MKRLTILIVSALAFVANANALSYSEARERAWYLTDKMAYELNLTEEQYDRAYEINLDYFLSVNTVRDADGIYWRYRNTDFGDILLDWQYKLFASTSYFFHPLVRVKNLWLLSSYDYYDRDFYYFRCPSIYNVYRGRSWRYQVRYNPYRNFRLPDNIGKHNRIFGMRDYYSAKFSSPNRNYDAHGSRSRVNRTPGKAYDYEWRNPGMRGNGNVTHHTNQKELNFGASQGSPRNNFASSRSNSGRKYTFGGNNYRDKAESGSYNFSSASRASAQTSRNSAENVSSRGQRKYSRSNVFGGDNEMRENTSARMIEQNKQRPVANNNRRVSSTSSNASRTSSQSVGRSVQSGGSSKAASSNNKTSSANKKAAQQTRSYSR